MVAGWLKVWEAIREKIIITVTIFTPDIPGPAGMLPPRGDGRRLTENASPREVSRSLTHFL